jgi:glycosyltransferase involved in cell wall biosynthesis
VNQISRGNQFFVRGEKEPLASSPTSTLSPQTETRNGRGRNKKKTLLIGNYPPPMCGWAIQTKLVIDELRRNGYVCEILKINENRQVKDSAYIDVQGGFDYLLKVLRYAMKGYRLNVHVNGQSKKGYILALIAVFAGRFTLHPALITFHGGLAQEFFPRPDHLPLRVAFRALFQLAGGIACDDDFVKHAIVDYGISAGKVAVIETFSPQYLSFKPVALPEEMEAFLSEHSPAFFCYVSFRPEYQLSMLREAMSKFRQYQSSAGFVWLGFPDRELPRVEEFVRQWPAQERASLLLLGNLQHDAFLTLLSRCTACIRTPACDGVAASVLESLVMGIPVVASENHRRPTGTITYAETDAADLNAKLIFVMENYGSIKASLERAQPADNVARMAEWLTT